MVVLLDLDLDIERDNDEDDLNRQLNIAFNRQLSSAQQSDVLHRIVPVATLAQYGTTCSDHQPSVGNTQYATLFASALACYPIALSLASYLDLNDLFALSLTCHEVHDALVQFAHNLRCESLRCVNDHYDSGEDASRVGTSTADTFKQAVEEQGYDMEMMGIPTLPTLQPPTIDYHGSGVSALGLTGRVSKCARDLVAPCRKCGVVVCRNCAVKPPSARLYSGRHRRLCKTCLDVPINNHLDSLKQSWRIHDCGLISGASSLRSVRSLSTSSVLSQASTEVNSRDEHTFTTPAFLRAACECDSRGVYLCQPCGQNLAAANTTYQRVWTWRSRYSTHIGGGLGTGLGQGEQGQKCGRGDYCLEKSAAGVCWVEIDCSEARRQDRLRHELFGSSRSDTPVLSDISSEQIRSEPGYLSQEIEGIGGVVKKKVKKRIKVGATVYEFEDERESGKYLERESSGELRSWCGWCFRVCPGIGDRSIVEHMMHA